MTPRIASLLLLAGALSLVAADPLARLQAAEDPGAIVEPFVEACRQLQTLPPAERIRVADGLEPYARRLFRSPEDLPGMDSLGIYTHVVQSGESPRAIMRRYAISDAQLKLLNPTYDDRRMRAGQSLKVVNNAAVGQFRVVVVKGAHRCLVFQWNSLRQVNLLLAAFPVGIGTTARPTPTGATTVGVMVRNPTWTHPDTREVIPPSDPRNVLGGYWIGLQPGSDKRFTSIGFHGYTGAPVEDWLEQGGSRGCLRLRQDDIHALYALAHKGLPVRIVP